MKLPPLDLDQVYEDLEGGSPFFRDKSFDAGEKLAIRETGENLETGKTRRTRRTRRTR
jgi:hypothetical protein